RMLERRQPGQKDPARLALVTRERQGTAEDVARRQHAEFVPQLPGAAPRIEHRDHGVDVQPAVALEAPDERGKPRAPAEASHVDTSQLHWRPILSDPVSPQQSSQELRCMGGLALAIRTRRRAQARARRTLRPWITRAA